MKRVVKIVLFFFILAFTGSTVLASVTRPYISISKTTHHENKNKPMNLPVADQNLLDDSESVFHSVKHHVSSPHSVDIAIISIKPACPELCLIGDVLIETFLLYSAPFSDIFIPPKFSL